MENYLSIFVIERRLICPCHISRPYGIVYTLDPNLDVRMPSFYCAKD